jgi:hypothetical protein
MPVGGSLRQFSGHPRRGGINRGGLDLLSDYRPHLIALCSRLDVPTARTLAEVKEPARDESSRN